MKSVHKQNLTSFRYGLYLESRRKSSKWLDSLDVQWSCQQVLLWNSFAQSREPRGLEVSVKGGLILVFKHVSTRHSCRYWNKSGRTAFFNNNHVYSLPIDLLKHLVLRLCSMLERWTRETWSKILTTSGSLDLTLLARLVRSSFSFRESVSRTLKVSKAMYTLGHVSQELG